MALIRVKNTVVDTVADTYIELQSITGYPNQVVQTMGHSAIADGHAAFYRWIESGPGVGQWDRIVLDGMLGSVGFKRIQAKVTNVVTTEYSLTPYTIAPGENQVEVYLNGTRLRVTEDFTESPDKITFVRTLRLNDELDFYLWVGGSLGTLKELALAPAGVSSLLYYATAATSSIYTTSTDSRNAFFKLDAAHHQAVDVHVNGLRLAEFKEFKVDFTTSKIEFLTALKAGDKVQIDVLLAKDQLVTGGISALKLVPFSFDGVTTTYDIQVDNAGVIEQIVVKDALQVELYIDGVRQIPDVDFTVSNAGIHFVDPPPSNSNNWGLYLNAQIGGMQHKVPAPVYVKAGLATLTYKSTAGQQNFDLSLQDIYTNTHKLTLIPPLEGIEVSLNGVRLVEDNGTGIGDYTIDRPNNEIVLNQPTHGGDYFQVDINVPPQWLSAGALNIYPLANLDINNTGSPVGTVAPGAAGMVDGIRTGFTLYRDAGSSTYAEILAGGAAEVEIYIDTVRQQPFKDYNVSGGTITFTNPPAAGSKIWALWYKSAANTSTVASPFHVIDQLSALPLTGSGHGDTYFAFSTGKVYVWNATASRWQEVGSSGTRVVANSVGRTALITELGLTVFQEDSKELWVYTNSGWKTISSGIEVVTSTAAMFALPFGNLKQGTAVVNLEDHNIYVYTRATPATHTGNIGDWHCVGQTSIDRVANQAALNALTVPQNTVIIVDDFNGSGQFGLLRRNGNVKVGNLTDWDVILPLPDVTPVEIVNTTADLPPPATASISTLYVVQNDADGNTLNRMAVWDGASWNWLNNTVTERANDATLLPISDRVTGDLAATDKVDHAALHVWNGSSWQLLFAEDEIKQWIAAGSLFQGTLNRIAQSGSAGLDQLPAPTASNRGNYWTWVGQSNFVIKSPATEKAELTAGGWVWNDITVGTTPFAHTPGAALAMPVTVGSTPGATATTPRYLSVEFGITVGTNAQTYSCTVPIVATDDATSIANKLNVAWVTGNTDLVSSVSGSTWTLTPNTGSTRITGMSVQDGGTPLIGTALSGETLQVGDWVQSNGTTWVHVSSDLISRVRGMRLWGLLPWAAGSWEQGALVYYKESLYRATAAITNVDGEPGSAGTAWEKLTIRGQFISVVSDTDLPSTTVGVPTVPTDQVYFVQNSARNQNRPALYHWNVGNSTWDNLSATDHPVQLYKKESDLKAVNPGTGRDMLGFAEREQTVWLWDGASNSWGLTGILSKNRADKSYMADWAPNQTWEQNSTVIYRATPGAAPQYFKASIPVIATDPAPGVAPSTTPTGAGTVWVIQAVAGVAVGTVLTVTLTPERVGSPITHSFTTVAGQTVANQLAIGLQISLMGNGAFSAAMLPSVTAGDTVTLTSSSTAAYTVTVSSPLTVSNTVPAALPINPWVDITPSGSFSRMDNVDVTTTALVNGDVLQFNAATNVWEPKHLITPITFFGSANLDPARVNLADNFGMDAAAVPAGVAPTAGDLYVSTTTGSVWAFSGVGTTGTTRGAYPTMATNTGLDIVNAALADLTDVDVKTTPPAKGQTLLWNDVTGKWGPGNTGQPLIYMGNGAFNAANVALPASNYGMGVGTVPNPQTIRPQTGDIYLDLLTGTVTMLTGGAAADRGVASSITGGTTSTALDFNKGALSKLTDVDLRTANPTEGQVLTYNAATSTWVPRAVATTLGALTDVTESPAPAAGNLLVAVGDGTWTEQANPSYTKAEINTRLDNIITGFSHDIAVLDILNVPPTNPDEEAAYIVGLAPTGAWAAHANDIAIWTRGQWEYQTPRAAESHLVEAKQAIYSWQPLPPPATGNRWIKVASTAATTGASARNGIGEIIPWLADTIPDSYLECRGQIVAVAAYPDLFAVIGSKYNGSTAADGVTTFALPNLQGYFLRGVGGSATGALGSTHDWKTGMPKAPFTASASAVADHTHHIYNERRVSGGSEQYLGDYTSGQNWPITLRESGGNDNGTIGPAGAHNHTITVAGGDSETAPAHMLVKWVIRVKAIDGGAQGPRGLPGAGAPAVGTDGQIIVARSGVWVAENNPLPATGGAANQLNVLAVDYAGNWATLPPPLVTRVNVDGHINNIKDNYEYTLTGNIWPASSTAISLEFFLADQTTQLPVAANTFSVLGASIHQVAPSLADNTTQIDCQSHRGWMISNNKLYFLPSSEKWKDGQFLNIDLIVRTFGNGKAAGPHIELKISGMDNIDRWSNGHWTIRPPSGQDLGKVFLTVGEGANYPHFVLKELRSFSY